MNLPERFVVCCARVVTCEPSRQGGGDRLGVIRDGAIYVDGGVLEQVGPRKAVIEASDGAPIVLDSPGVMTPGLVDAHTHAAWAGSRHDEYAMRMAGQSYEAIAAAGGGILSTMKAVRSAREEDLVLWTAARLRRMAALGTTTCEIKSGYGLDLQTELKQLQAIGTVASDRTLPRVVPTYLALHAVPPEGRNRRKEWVDEVAKVWVPIIAERRLAQYVDAYIDRNAFSVDEARTVFSSAREFGLGIRAHVGQFADIGGLELAVEAGAASVDHLENTSAESVQKLASSSTRGVLLPIASYTLRQAPPPVGTMRRAGVRMVIATDANPGTSPTESLPLAMALAVRDYGMSPEEVLEGTTREAAAALGLEDHCGRISSGFDADFVVWDLPHERAIVQPWGSAVTRMVVARGRLLHWAQ